MSISALWPYPLRYGVAADPSQGACAMQAINWLVHERQTDSPLCVDDHLRDIVVNINDSLDDTERQELLPYLPRIAGSIARDLVFRRVTAGLLAVIVARAEMESWHTAGTLRVLAEQINRDLATDGPIRSLGPVNRALTAFTEGVQRYPSDGVFALQALKALINIEVPDAYRVHAWLHKGGVSPTGYDAIHLSLALTYLNAYLAAGPQGEPWSAERVDAAVKSYQAAGAPPVPAKA